MHTDARNLENDTLIEGDICIIGSGAAGLSIALEWMDTPYRVILLEGGGFAYEQEMQDLYRGEITGQQYYLLHGTRLHYFGGTTGHWAGFCSPFDPIDFEKRDWVPHSGWPISRDDLDPFYARANQTIQLGPYNYDLEYWQQEMPDMNPFPFDKKVIWNKMWQFNAARFGTLYREPILNSRNIHLYTYANVVDIKASDNLSHVTELVVKNLAGKTHRVRAKKYIMAAGAMQNARLLLASNNQAPMGLGNTNDLVGRYFMEHIEVASGELWLLKPFVSELYSLNWRPRAELAITPEVQKKEQILNGTASLSPLAMARHIPSRMDLLQDDDYNRAVNKFIDSFGEAEELAKKENTGPVSRAFEFQTRLEQAPNPDSRLTLNGEKDALGMPRIDFHWDLTELDQRSIRKINEIIGYQAGMSGLGRVRLREFLIDGDDKSWPASETNAGWHHMGTTRMSDDPKQGVVDANCKIHGIDNLYVAGSGCFATSAAPNPTLTIVALSIRLSDHVREQMKASS